MKRDFELIREILIDIENAETFDERLMVRLNGRTDNEIEYHLLLLAESGLVIIDEMDKDYGIRVLRLTSAGHDFLDAARNATIWNKTQKFIKEKGGSVTMSIFKALLTKALEKTFLE